MGTKVKPNPKAITSEGPSRSPRYPAVHRYLGEPYEAAGEEHQSGNEHAPDPSERDEWRGGRRGENDAGGQRKLRDARRDGAVVKDSLHIQREEVEEADDRCSGREHGRVGGAWPGQSKERERHQRRLGANLDQNKGDQQSGGTGERADGLCRAPADNGGPHERVDEGGEPGRYGHRTWYVEAAERVFGATLPDQPR
jgi:hypothetical protein